MSSAETLACPQPNRFPTSLCHVISYALTEHQYKKPPNEGIFLSFTKLSIKDTIPLVSVLHIRNPSYKRIHISSPSLNLEPKKEKLLPPKNDVPTFTYHILSHLWQPGSLDTLFLLP